MIEQKTLNSIRLLVSVTAFLKKSDLSNLAVSLAWLCAFRQQNVNRRSRRWRQGRRLFGEGGDWTKRGERSSVIGS